MFENLLLKLENTPYGQQANLVTIDDRGFEILVTPNVQIFGTQNCQNGIFEQYMLSSTNGRSDNDLVNRCLVLQKYLDYRTQMNFQDSSNQAFGQKANYFQGFIDNKLGAFCDSQNQNSNCNILNEERSIPVPSNTK